MENMFNQAEEKTNVDAVKNIAGFAKTVSIEESSNPSYNFNLDGSSKSSFRVCANTLPEKTSIWTKVKNVLFYEIKVELTPYEQKIEDEINDFLHQEVTLKTVRDFLFQEISFRKKKNA